MRLLLAKHSLQELVYMEILPCIKQLAICIEHGSSLSIRQDHQPYDQSRPANVLGQPGLRAFNYTHQKFLNITSTCLVIFMR